MVNGLGASSLGQGLPAWAPYLATNPQSLKLRTDSGYELGEDEAAFGLGDGSAELGGGFHPLLDDDFDVGEGFAVGFSARHSAGEFRDLSDESLVLLAPVNDDLIPGLRHRARLPNRISVQHGGPALGEGHHDRVAVSFARHGRSQVQSFPLWRE